jgi:hypothetical protein
MRTAQRLHQRQQDAGDDPSGNLAKEGEFAQGGNFAQEGNVTEEGSIFAKDGNVVEEGEFANEGFVVNIPCHRQSHVDGANENR